MRIHFKPLNSIIYYFRFLALLYRLPIRLRLIDVEALALDIQELREASDKELAEYLEYLAETRPEYFDQTKQENS